MEERTALTPEFGRIFDVDYRYKQLFPTCPFPKGNHQTDPSPLFTIPLFCCAAVPGSPMFSFASFSHAP